MPLLLLFIAIPLIEIALFIQIGGLIGLWPTLGIVVLTAVLGTWLVRTQGRLAMTQLRDSFSQLDDPTEPLAHGAMILIAGALLLTPGFFTDAVGFALLFPPFRSAAFRYVRARVKIQRFEMGAASSHAAHATHRPHPRPSDPDIIDGEFQEIDPEKRPTHGNSGWTRH